MEEKPEHRLHYQEILHKGFVLKYKKQISDEKQERITTSCFCGQSTYKINHSYILSLVANFLYHC